MRTFIAIMLFVLSLNLTSFAQAPNRISYQAVIRDSEGNLVKNQQISLRIAISANLGSFFIPIYGELHNPQTNENGLVSIEIGGGTSPSSAFEDIDWSSGNLFIGSYIDLNGGTDYTITSSSQILSVPYALYAEKVNMEQVKEELFEEFLNAGLNGIVKDVIGNSYKTIKIGNQVWMAENLKTTKYNDGTAIPYVTNGTTWSSLTTPAYCWYNNDFPTYGETYGALYNWYTVNTAKLCPSGWHVPNDAEWEVLTDYLGGESVAGGKLKETGTAHWNSPNTGATNETGFTALPGGYNGDDGVFYFIGNSCRFWSATAGKGHGVYYNLTTISSNAGHFPSTSGYSVRCVRD